MKFKTSMAEARCWLVMWLFKAAKMEKKSLQWLQLNLARLYAAYLRCWEIERICGWINANLRLPWSKSILRTFLWLGLSFMLVNCYSCDGDDLIEQWSGVTVWIFYGSVLIPSILVLWPTKKKMFWWHTSLHMILYYDQVSQDFKIGGFFSDQNTGGAPGCKIKQ